MFIREFSPSKRCQLLLVDDLPDNLFLLQAVFGEESAYEVSCADNGHTALEMIAKSPPDLILLDVMMPGISGYEVTRKVRQNLALPDIPILLVTAHEEINHKNALAAGANGFVRKPFDIDYLVSRVEQALQTQHATCC